MANSSEKMASPDQPDHQNQVADNIQPSNNKHFDFPAVDLHSKYTICHALIVDKLIIWQSHVVLEKF